MGGRLWGSTQRQRKYDAVLPPSLATALTTLRRGMCVGRRALVFCHPQPRKAAHTAAGPPSAHPADEANFGASLCLDMGASASAACPLQGMDLDDETRLLKRMVRCRRVEPPS